MTHNYPFPKKQLLLLFLLIAGTSLLSNCRHAPESSIGPSSPTPKPQEKGVLTLDTTPMSNHNQPQNPFFVHDTFDEVHTYDHQKGLKLNFFQSSKEGMLPLVIFLPPGGFMRFDKDEALTRHMCRDFARAGYHTASASYTLLKHLKGKDWRKGLDYGRSKIGEAIIDVANVIQYFKEFDHPGIDTSQIFIAGISAGAILALHTVCTEEDELVDFTNGSLGKLSYQKPRIKGSIAISGALLADHIDDLDKEIPLLLVHGEEDMTVPIGHGSPYTKYLKDAKIDLPGINYEAQLKSQKNGSTTIEGFNTSFVIPKWVFELTLSSSMPKVFGSHNIKEARKVNTTLYKVKNGKHAFMVNKNGMLNQTYDSMRTIILNFLIKHTK